MPSFRICSIALALCVMISVPAAVAKTQVRGAAIKAHTAFLADDLLEGRDTGSKGHEIAAAYVAAQFEAFGLTPVPGAANYYQSVPLRRRSLASAGARLTLISDQQSIVLTNGKEIAVDASAHALDEILDAELMFVGWGITAPSLGQDDYDGLNVKGKAVVLLEGAPASFPGALRAHYSWVQNKERMAAERGAVAILTLKSPARERVSPWERARHLRPLPAMAWRSPDGAAPAPAVKAIVTLGPDTARNLFAQAGHDLDSIYRASESAPPRGFPLSASIRLERHSTHEDIVSPNVLGLLAGRDPRLRNQYVVVAAHLDHVGVGAAVNGDSIYNGAVDNAGGVATILEVARSMSAGRRPKRSVLFFATTGEEKGLIGADYFVAHPLIPLRDIVAAISVDGLMAFHDFSGIVALGADHSTLGDISSAAARRVGAVHVPDPIPERGNLALSDQYPFLRAGIPVLFPNPARGAARSGTIDTAAWDEYESKHYHQPSDDMNLPLRWDIAERWARYIEAVVSGAANAAQPPTWYAGDALAEVFAAHARRAPRSNR